MRVAVLREAAGDGVLGTLVNFGNHVELLWDRNFQLTADVAGYARRGLARGLDYDGALYKPGLGGTEHRGVGPPGTPRLGASQELPRGNLGAVVAESANDGEILAVLPKLRIETRRAASRQMLARSESRHGVRGAQLAEHADDPRVVDVVLPAIAVGLDRIDVEAHDVAVGSEPVEPRRREHRLGPDPDRGPGVPPVGAHAQR